MKHSLYRTGLVAFGLTAHAFAEIKEDDMVRLDARGVANLKLELVEALLNDLDRTDDGVDAAWAVEAEDRLAAYRKGEIRAIPLAQVLAKYRA